MSSAPSPKNSYHPPAAFSPIHVYLAGPVTGCTSGEAHDWRKTCDNLLRPYNIIGMSPLRCEPIIGARYGLENPEDSKFGIAKSIASKNDLDVDMCRMGLFYIPKPVAAADELNDRFDAWHAIEARRHNVNFLSAFQGGMNAAKLHSFGTLIELAWTFKSGKKTILVSDDPFVLQHPLVDACAHWKQPTLADGCDVLIQILGGYTGGKNV